MNPSTAIRGTGSTARAAESYVARQSPELLEELGALEDETAQELLELVIYLHLCDEPSKPRESSE